MKARVVLTAAIALTLLPRGWRDAGFRRAMAISIVILLLAVVSKFLLPPDSYFADALVRAALHFFDPDIFKVDIVLLLLATMAGYGAICIVLSRLGAGRAPLLAAGIVAAALAVYWLHFDQGDPCEQPLLSANGAG